MTIRRLAIIAPNDSNKRIIEEFRANEGRVGGPFEGATLLLLHTVGSKSGEARVNPLVCDVREDGFVVFASKAGADTNPSWYYNLLAQPSVSAEFGTERVRVTARVAEGDEREALWQPWKARMSAFQEYEQKTSRTIPVVILERDV